MPGATLALAVRHIWPGLLLLVTTLIGVGVTMSWPFALDTHLGWLAALIAAGSAISATLLGAAPGTRSGHDHRHPEQTG